MQSDKSKEMIIGFVYRKIYIIDIKSSKVSRFAAFLCQIGQLLR